MKLVFTWIQGCWKWTHWRILVEKYWYTLIEMGWEFRKVIESGSELWKELKEIMDKWYQVPWDLWKKIMEEAINNNIEKENALGRLLWRMYDTETWETFPSGTQVNPKTWNKLIRRSDDNEAWILKRIDEFVEKTLPIVKIQEQEWRVIKINSDQSIEDVSKEVISKLGL